MVRDMVDFFVVEEHQLGMHGRLENWGAWCRPGRGTSDSSPMFRLYRSAAQARWGHPAPESRAVDKLDAQAIAKGVIALPDPHMRSLQWYYVKPCSPERACRALATTRNGLALFVRDARQMLINRRV
jgi:hypothetical protein